MHLVPIPENVHTRYFVLGSGVLNELPELLKTAFPGRKPVLIADENTFRAAGTKTLELLRNAGFPAEICKIFPGKPRLHAMDDYSNELAPLFPEDCVPVAVGSGVINDLVKRASELRKLLYCCVATAASMDGYTASGAALHVQGRKITQPCHAPYALLADIDILKSAPATMLSAGYGDLMAKVPAGAEWRIVDSLGIEKIEPTVFRLVQSDLKDWLTDPHDLLKVFKGLACTGFALQLYGDSRPCSGAEHLFSHVLDMDDHLSNGEPVSHGFQVAVGTVITTRLLEYVMNHTSAQIQAMARPLETRAEREKNIDLLLENRHYGNTREVAMKKFLEGEAAAARRADIYRKWDSWKPMIAAQIIPSHEVIRRLRQASCPVFPMDIGLDETGFRHTLKSAQLIRKRYTITDLLYEAGVFEDAIDSIA